MCLHRSFDLCTGFASEFGPKVSVVNCLYVLMLQSSDLIGHVLFMFGSRWLQQLLKAQFEGVPTFPFETGASNLYLIQL